MLRALVVLALILLGSMIFLELSDSFRPYNVSSPLKLPYPENDRLTPEVAKLLDQNFSYLNKGAQSYAFLSEDGQYVLKVIKQKRLRPALWEKLFEKMPLTASLAAPVSAFKARNRALILKGCTVAARCRDLTGLVYSHPNGSNDHYLLVNIDGRKLNLGELSFYLQKKGEPLIPTLTTLSESEQEEALSALVSLLIERARRGFYDQDNRFLLNVGFAGKDPFFVDFGEFDEDPGMTSPLYIRRQLKPLTAYLEEHNLPLNKKLQKILDERVAPNNKLR